MEPDIETIRAALRITCADAVELVTDRLDDALSRPDRDRFDTHLAGCQACAVHVEQVLATVRVLRASTRVGDGPSATRPSGADVDALVRRFRAVSGSPT